MASITNAEITVGADGLVRVGSDHMVRLRDIVFVQRRKPKKGTGTAIGILIESERLRGQYECASETIIISDWEFDRVIAAIEDAQRLNLGRGCASELA